MNLAEKISSPGLSVAGGGHVQVSRRLGPAAGRRYIGYMCGRARLSSDVSEIKIAFGIPPERPTPNFPPSWNVAPTDSLPIVRFNPKEGQRSLDMMRWGLIPYWAKDIKVGFANINANPAQNVRKSQQYDYRVATNGNYRSSRMRKECGPIRDPELRANCLGPLGEVPRGRHGTLSTAGPRQPQTSD